MGANLLIVTPGKQETSGMMPIIAGSFRKLTYENAKELQRNAAGIKDISAGPEPHSGHLYEYKLEGCFPER